jgi:thiopeptide-type bacteriocin biosynthesis protein
LLPRVRIGNAIVSRAAWNVTAAELAPITAAVRAMEKAATKNVHAPDHAARQSAVAAAVAALRETRRLPRMFMLSSGDNELPIDLENPLLVAAFADEVAGAERVRLTEMFPTPDRLFATGPEGAFADELILLFTRQRDASAAKTEPSPHAGPKINSPAIRRAFPPGSEWLYAKIYCGESTGDRVLCDAIGPVAREALASGDARQWFFIRYHDPEPHVRVRLLGDPARLCANVLPMLERRMAPLMSTGAVHKVMVDTYVREIERYAEHGIELVEQLFWRDSEAVLAIVELLEGEAGAIARWKLCVRGIDSLLDAVGMSLEQRAKIYTSAKEMLGRELSANTPMWARIGDKFASERAELEHLFDRDPVRDEAHELGPGLEILRNRDAAIAPIAAELRRRDAAGELQPSLRDMAWSLVHMHANRMLHASQRAQELVLYDFLRRLHAARAARSKQR